MSAVDRLIVALDQPTLDAALGLVDRLSGLVARFKVGLELFSAAGPRAVEAVQARGGRVFLDLKFHDIPETVRRAAAAGAASGAELITVHAAGGSRMLVAAVEGAGGAAKVLAVTALTSVDAAELARVGTVTNDLEQLVLQRAQVAREAGCDGVVASPLEAALLRAAFGPGFLIITPGIRSATSPSDDQRRTATAGEAIARGADAVVVGRPIRDAADPRGAAAALLAELA